MEAAPFPEPLLRGFFPVDAPLLVDHYNAGLEAVGTPATALSHFHIDAAGYSPEVADELGDPLYLGSASPLACGLVVSVAQLGGPLVHPGLGFAAEAFRNITARARHEIASLTMREPLIAEARFATSLIDGPHQLADLEHFELHFRTPGGLVRGRRQLEERKREFMESDRRWLDDEFIEDMAELARQVRDLGPLPAELLHSRHRLGPCHLPLFGGSYVLEERGGSLRSAITHVLSAAPAPEGQDEIRSARGRRVDVRPLEAEAVVDLLLQHKVARLDAGDLQQHPEVIDRLQYWILVHHITTTRGHEDGEGAGLPLAPAELARELDRRGASPPDYRELADLQRRLASAAQKIPLDALSPLNRLRLLTPSSTREPVVRFVRHVQASVDTADLEGAWRHAPDLFFARWRGLAPALRHYFERWLGSRSEAGRPRQS
ncbi:MAG: hypothetical protein O7G30_13725 [Proteobacteria bacterium]|nr:hypothetical protein [Pseudomonadota bacterium]